MSQKTFKIQFDFDANIRDLQTKMQQISQQMGQIGQTSGTAQLQKQFDGLTAAIERVKIKASSPITSKSDFANLERELRGVENGYANLLSLITRLEGVADKQKLELLPEDQKKRISDSKKALEQYDKAIQSTAKDREKLSKLEASKITSVGKKNAANTLLAKYNADLQIAQDKLKATQELQAELLAARDRASADQKSARAKVKKDPNDATAVANVQQAAEAYRKLDLQYKETSNQAKQAQETVDRLNNEIKEQTTIATTAEAEIADLETKIRALNNAQPQKLKQAFDELKLAAQQIGGIETKDITDVKQIDELIRRFQKLSDDGVADAEQAIQNFRNKIEGLKPTLDKSKSGLEQNAEAYKEMSRAAQDIENLKNQFLHFFSITNSVQLFKRTIQSALNTVKELDATMTEAAVVTDFSIGDMWAQLPRYSKEAQNLGVSINGMYQATTLYYQQGLKTNEAMQLGVETMKMAKIAAMDSTEATTAMTAALRGFNMELNEISATRVNDVYSQLAAVTAADTNQIATAMEKTASIAASANMQFESTAALLAQIIETTQEAPETAGTALKTIIARFSEVKSLASQGLVSGKDSEGEVIDVNKIQTALRQVGISMDGFFAGTEGLDSILLKLSEKWGTLDFETQRYIATMAAGSRQQSRFLAMMGDYGRTMELVDSANNSAGASQKQFEKTTESLETSLNRLKNAWNEFTMGLANNEILKLGVDLLTKFLETVNSLSEAISGGGGLAKSIINLVTVIGALKGGKVLLGGLFGDKIGAIGGKLGSFFGFKEVEGQAENIGKKSGNAFTRGFQQASAEKNRGGNSLLGFFGITGTQNPEHAANAALSAQLSGIKAKGKFANMAALDKIKEGLDTQSISAKQAAKQMNSLGIALNNNSKQALESTKGFNKLKVSMQGATFSGKELINGLASIGSIGLIAGGAISLLGAKISETDKELGETIQKIGQWTTGISAVFTALPAITKYKQLNDIQKVSVQKIGAVAIAIAAVAAGAALASDQFKKLKNLKTFSDDIEEIDEQASSLSDQLQKVKTEISEISDKRNQLEDLEKGFKGLTQGTAEWKEQLIQANSQVLETIEKYPELAQYVTKGKHGQLEIAQEGWQKLADEQLQQQNTLINAQSALALQKNNLTQKQAFDEQIGDMDKEILKDIQNARTSGATTEKTLMGAGIGLAAGAGIAGTAAAFGATIGSVVPVIGTLIGAGLGLVAGTLAGAVIGSFESLATAEEVEREQLGITAEDFNKFAAIAAEKNLSLTGGSNYSEFKELFDTSGFQGDFEKVWNSMQKLGSGFDELANSAYATKQANDAILSNVITNISSQSDTLSNSENKFVAEEIAKKTYEDYSERVAQRSEEIEKEMKDNTKKGQWIEKYAQETEQNLNKVKKQLADGEISEKDIANYFGTKKVENQIKNSMEEITKITNRIIKNKTPELQKIISEGFADSIDTLSLSTITNGPRSANDWKALIGKSGEDKELQLLTGGAMKTWEEYYNYLANRQTEFNEIVNDAFAGVGGRAQIDQLNSYITGLGGIELTAKQAVNWASKLEDVKNQGGEEERLLSFIPQLTAGLRGEDLDQAMNYLNTSSWKTTSDIDNTINALKELGVSINRDLTRELYQATEAIYSFNAAELQEKLKSLGSLSDMVKEKITNDSSIFTSEEMQKLINAGITNRENFKRVDYDSFIILQPIENLLQKIEENTSFLRTDTITGLAEKVAIGESIKAAMESEDTYVGEQVLKYRSASGVDYYRNEQNTISEIMAFLKDPNWQTKNIPIETLQKIASSFGFEEGQYKDLAVEEIRDLLLGRWGEVYGEGGVVLAQNKKYLQTEGQDMSDWHQMAQAGTTGFYGTVYDSGVLKNQGQIDLMKAIKQDEDFLANNIDNQNILQQMREMAGQFGITDAEKRDFEELYSILKYLDDAEGAEKNLDALIQAEAGLKGVVENSTEALKEQGSVVADDSLTVKNFVIKIDAENDAMAALGKTLEENQELLEEGAWGTERYSAALQKIGKGLEDVLGGEVTDEFIHQHRQLFTTILEGGDDSAAAYQELMAQYLWSTGKMTAEANALIMKALAEARKYGTIDLTQYIQDLDALPNITEEIARMALNAYFTTMSNPTGTSTIGSIRDYGSLFGGKSAKKAKKEEQPWENPYDKFYNTTEKINEALRQREKLERRYSKLIEKNQATADKLVASAKEELAVLAREQELQEKMISNRKWQIEKYISQKGLTKYAYLGENEFTGAAELRINWSEINKVTSQDKGSKIEEYISQLEEWFDSLEEAQDSLEEIEDAVDEIKKRGEDEYFELENKIKDAVVQYYQDQIDELDAINTSINDTNSKLIDAMQESISKQRQARDNEKTEEELSDKQRRLMYLYQDTSGGNDLEILKLQKELEQGQEDYTDTLIDQKISELQEQNDRAAEQRQQQIDIANEQLEHWKKTGEVWNEVYALMGNGIDPITGKIIAESDLERILLEYDQFDGLSTLGQMNWLSSLETTTAKALNYLKTGRQLEDLEDYSGKAGQKVTFTTADGATLTGVTDKHGNVKVGNQTYSGVYQNFDGGFRTDETTKKQETPQKVGSDKDEESQTGPAYSEPKDNSSPKTGTLQHGLTAEQVTQLQNALKKYGYYKMDSDGKYGPGTQKAVQEYWKKEYGEGKKGTEGAETLTSIQSTSYGLLTGRTESQAKRNIRVTKTQKGNYPVWNGMGAPFIDPVVSVDEGGIPWLDDKTIGSRKKGKLGNVIFGGKVYPIDRFKTGGLADYTGPAWLDGTKSKPEIVLNAQDTKNFIQLKDVLASLMSRPVKSSENTGDSTYDIDINVESIGSDYDVEQLASKIKNMINQDARYRNNNAIHLMR